MAPSVEKMIPVFGSVVVVVLLQVILAMLVRRGAATELSSEVDFAFNSVAEDPLVCSRTDPAMNPIYEVKYGQDVVWQIPPNPKAVLFMAHGMDKEPLSYFDAGPNCPRCYGLPEDRAAVLAALKRRYAVILVKSVGTYWFPWNVQSWPPPPSRDRTIVVSVVKEWTREHSLEHLPLAAFGHSSGGNFSTLLTLDLEIKSLVLMCTPGEFAVLEHADALFPPTLFIPMPLDNGPLGFYPLVLNAMSILRSKGLVAGEFDAWPRPVYPMLFAEKIPCLGGATSAKIYAAYKAEGWLDDNDYVVINPRISDWESVLWKYMALPFCNSLNDLCLARHVKQELMTAYAEHSLTSWADDAMYNWLDDSLFLGSSQAVRMTASL